MTAPTLGELIHLMGLADHPDQSPCDAIRFDQRSGDYVRSMLVDTRFRAGAKAERERIVAHLRARAEAYAQNAAMLEPGPERVRIRELGYSLESEANFIEENDLGP